MLLNPILISYFVPEHLDFATYSKDLSATFL
jgi:hypothetical protein